MQRILRFFTLATLCIVFAQSVVAQNTQLRSTLTFPGQTLANICGWTAPDGKEYALIGGSKGLIIVDISNPDVPVEIVQIPGPDNLWKEIKTYSHYAYVTSEGGGGVQIVDLSGLPSASLLYHNYTGTGEIAGQLAAIHALHIDVTKGYLYTFGGGFSSARIHDLNADPYNPVYVGKFDQLGYIHDGFADNDTLYAGHIYAGILSMVDMTDKNAPQILGSVETPGKFTHNAWIHSSRKHIFTTDEATPSFVTSYDVSDPTDIKELDRFSIDNGNGSIGHNVHIINDFAVTSWYTGGVVITDVKRPDFMIKVGQYDTWAGVGPGFDGCWGAFPYFPSGTIVASNIDPGQLFVITPTYQRAAYLQVNVKNGCNNQPMIGANVQIVGGSAPAELTNNQGVVKTGQVETGVFNVTISKSGFVTQTVSVNLATSELSTLSVTLEPSAIANVTGTITDNTGQPLAGIPFSLSNSNGNYSGVSNGNGQFTIDCVNQGTYTLSAGEWGFVANGQTVNINGTSNLTIALQRGYYDDFRLDYGWTTDATSPTGLWERGEPQGTNYQGAESNPDFDVSTDQGDQCFVTGNGGGGAGSDDVDAGSVTLTSPAMDLSGQAGAIMRFDYWFFNSGGNGGAPNDNFEVIVSNGTQSATILSQTVSESAWRSTAAIKIEDYVPLTDNVTVRFIATDLDPGHLVEAALDRFSVELVPVGVVNIDDSARLQVAPNPSTDAFTITFDWPNSDNPILEVRNALGQLVSQRALTANSGTATLGTDWLPGVYTAFLRTGNSQSKAFKLVKN
jgi:choice-of-anchor B domain-containing protein